MRTTIAIPDELSERVRLYAWSRDLSVSRALEDLIRRGLAPSVFIVSPAEPGRLTPLPVPPDSPPITTERVLELQREMDLEYDRRQMGLAQGRAGAPLRQSNQRRTRAAKRESASHGD